MGAAIDRLIALSQISVTGYTRKDGVRVKPHIRITQGTHGFYDKATSKRFAVATDPATGKEIGHIGWRTEGPDVDPAAVGQIFIAETNPDYEGQGVATALYQAAKADTPNLRHSNALSPSARKWIESLKRKGLM